MDTGDDAGSSGGICRSCCLAAMSETLDCYTYHVFWSFEDQEYVATCIEFPSLSHLDSDPSAALGGIRDLVRDVIEDMKQAGER